jgi:o-succinylbenzoate synthase
MISLTRLIEQRIRLTDDLGGAGSVGDAQRTWSERRTLLVVVEDGEGHTGLGEAAPLDDYSPDSFDDAFQELAPLVGASLGAGARRAPESAGELRAATPVLRSPAARFALESALVELSARRRGEPAWWLLARLHAELVGSEFDGESFDAGRKVAALLPSEPERALEHATRAFARGIRCFKAKVGARNAWTEELELLRAVRRRFPHALLRVDANQSFSPHELWQWLPALQELDLEWLEEPVPKFPRGLEKLAGFPLALDESLQNESPNEATLHEHGVRAFVLKPTTLGGYLRSFELASVADSAGIAVVASHAYEGPVGFSAIAALSLALGSGRPADGLDRHAALADAPSLPAFDSERGFVHAWSEPGFGLELAALLERRPVVREVRA